jgi:NADPH-dependent 2,4-dienoyl-CoA reductase/sulfur reductase-like enzyme
VIIGGGPAGLSAAKSYRDCGGLGEVVMLSADEALPYNRPPLSKEFLQGTMSEAGLDLEQDHFYADNGVDVRLNTRVIALRPEQHEIVTVGSGSLSYTGCVLATGSSALRLGVGGADHPRIFTLRTLADARRLAEAAASANRVTVIGSGFIGCEVAASLSMRGLDVVLVTQESLPQQQRLGDHAGSMIAGWLDGHGVELVLDSELREVSQDSTLVHLDDRMIKSDLIVLAAGAVPNVQLAAKAGLVLDEGRIRTDQHMQTSAADVYAVGDIARAFNPAAGRHLTVEHWGEALAMGEVAGSHFAGARAAWTQAPGFWSTIGDRTLKYVAWGDGFDTAHVRSHGNGAFSVWYSTGGVVVGALTHEADTDYERARELVERAAPDSAI